MYVKLALACVRPDARPAQMMQTIVRIIFVASPEVETSVKVRDVTLKYLTLCALLFESRFPIIL